MEIVTATSLAYEAGPHIKVVRAFVETQKALLAKGIQSAADWAPLAEFVETERFKRVGAYLEELDWDAFTRFLTGWIAGDTRFEMTEFHISEIGNAVFQEIEERHFRGDEFIRKNVIAVYRFSDAGRIVHLDIYEQARDSGRWIAEAAENAVEPG